jgi:nucleotide-binding universal stress UspA family protein
MSMIALKEQPALTRWFESLLSRAGLSGRMEKPSRRNVIQPPDRQSKPGRPVKNILVPTDFSAGSTEALAKAAALARQHDATLTILHVIDINPPAALTHSGPADKLMRQLWATGMSELRRLEASLAQNQIKTRTLIVEGLPAEAIVEKSAAFDLLAIGEERPKPAWSLFSKRTARCVIEQAECPVLVVHPNQRPQKQDRKAA